MDKAEFTQKRRLIVKLGKMLHKYGTPSFRLEAYLLEVATHLGLHASFISTPTSLNFVIWTDKHEDEYNLSLRLQPGDLDMNSLSLTDELASQLLAGDVSLTDADQSLDRIDNMGSPYGKLLTWLAFGFSTAGFSVLMGASALEILWSGILGSIAYFWTLWSQYSKRIHMMLEPVTAIVSGFGACVISRFFDPGINIPLIVLSSIIILVPGLALTMGLAELSSRNMVSGTARIMDAIMQLFKLYFGAFIGIALGFALLGENQYQPQTSLPFWATWVALFVLSMTLVVIFRTRVKHIPWALAAAFLAYAATTWGAMFAQQGLGAFVGAFALGVFANVFTRITRQPATIVAMHGLIVLVPGSKTYMGLNSFISGKDFVNAQQVGQEVFLVFMSLVAGLIFANAVVPTKKAL